MKGRLLGWSMVVVTLLIWGWAAEYDGYPTPPPPPRPDEYSVDPRLRVWQHCIPLDRGWEITQVGGEVISYNLTPERSAGPVDQSVVPAVTLHIRSGPAGMTKPSLYGRFQLPQPDNDYWRGLIGSVANYDGSAPSKVPFKIERGLRIPPSPGACLRAKTNDNQLLHSSTQGELSFRGRTIS